MITWKVFYDDGSAVTSDTPIEHVPPLGVEVIALIDETMGRKLIFRYDFYYFQGMWFGSDIFGMFDYLQRPGMKRVLFGRTISEEAFREIYARAVDDPDLPPKSAWLPREKVGF